MKEVLKEGDDRLNPVELVELVGTVAKYGTLMIGGLCLLVYSHRIGQFPEGVGLGEGLAFYLVCAGFLLAYALYALICTATGCLLLAVPATALHRFAINRQGKSKRRHGQLLLHTDFAAMRSGPILAMGALGLAGHAIYIFYNTDPWNASLWLGVPLMQGIGVVFFLTVLRRQEHFDSGVVVPDYSDGPTAGRRNDAAMARRAFVIWLAIAPLVLAPERLFLFDAAFRVAQLRKDAATIHVKSPWSDRVAQSTLAKAPSVLGSDYVEFKKVNVLLRSVGQKVVLELPTASGFTKLSIPADAVEIE